MSKAVATVVLVSAALALGVTPAKFQFSIARKDGSTAPGMQELDALPTDGTVTFGSDTDPLTAGDYIFSALRLGSDGNPIAPAVTADFTIPEAGTAPGATEADVPSSVTIAVS